MPIFNCVKRTAAQECVNDINIVGHKTTYVWPWTNDMDAWCDEMIRTRQWTLSTRFDSYYN